MLLEIAYDATHPDGMNSDKKVNHGKITIGFLASMLLQYPWTKTKKMTYVGLVITSQKKVLAITSCTNSF